MLDQVQDPDGIVHEIDTLVPWRLNATKTVCGETKFTPSIVETDLPPNCLVCVGSKRR
jgi:hypothetical protein